MPISKSEEPYTYTDTGTGAYPNPPSEITYTHDVSAESTGAVEGPPAEVTYSGEIDLTPTGAHPNPPAEVTVSQFWPSKTAATQTVTEQSAGQDVVKPAASKRSTRKKS